MLIEFMFNGKKFREVPQYEVVKKTDFVLVRDEQIERRAFYLVQKEMFEEMGISKWGRYSSPQIWQAVREKTERIRKQLYAEKANEEKLKEA